MKFRRDQLRLMKLAGLLKEDVNPYEDASVKDYDRTINLYIDIYKEYYNLPAWRQRSADLSLAEFIFNQMLGDYKHSEEELIDGEEMEDLFQGYSKEEILKRVEELVAARNINEDVNPYEDIELIDKVKAIIDEYSEENGYESDAHISPITYSKDKKAVQIYFGEDGYSMDSDLWNKLHYELGPDFEIDQEQQYYEYNEEGYTYDYYIYDKTARRFANEDVNPYEDVSIEVHKETLKDALLQTAQWYREEEPEFWKGTLSHLIENCYH
jgi:hypothetical protein